VRAIFVIDASSNERSPLVQRLMRAGYLVLNLADCRTALEVLRCLLPDLVIVDVAAMGVRATVDMLTALDRDDDNDAHRPAVPVLVVGAKLSDYRKLAGRLRQGEIVPAACSTPDVVLEHVGRHVELAWPPHRKAEPAGAGSAVMHDGRRWDGPTHERLTPRPKARRRPPFGTT
jgi:DNA-binding NtrC family response regulator